MLLAATFNGSHRGLGREGMGRAGFRVGGRGDGIGATSGSLLLHCAKHGELTSALDDVNMMWVTSYASDVSTCHWECVGCVMLVR
jgi:hypothetical protein